MSVPSDVLKQLQKRYRAPKLLLEIDTTTPMRYCTGQDPVVYDSNTYTPRQFSVSAVQYGDGERAGFTATIQDIDGAIELRSMTDEITGALATLVAMVKDDDGDWLTPWVLMSAPVQSAQGSMFANIRASAAFGLNSRGALRPGARTCRYRFKEGRCGYSGGLLTCDRSWADCTTRSNTARFGGWRFAPAPNSVVDLGPVGVIIPASPGGTNEYPWSLGQPAPEPPAPRIPGGRRIPDAADSPGRTSAGGGRRIPD